MYYSASTWQKLTMLNGKVKIQCARCQTFFFLLHALNLLQDSGAQSMCFFVQHKPRINNTLQLELARNGWTQPSPASIYTKRRVRILALVLLMSSRSLLTS